jgi:hypothetical protein
MNDGLEALYRAFTQIWGNGHPIRAPAELEAAVRAQGLDDRTAGEQWLRSLSPAWVYHDSDEPFADEQANRAYRRELRDLLA